MPVTIEYEGKMKKVVAKRGMLIRDALSEADVNPETVIVKRDGEIVPDEEKVKDKDKLIALRIVSGG